MKQMRCYVGWLALLVLLPLSAAGQTQNIQARVSGGGGNGKCTFEVVVNGSAEVQIRGSQGQLRTLSGRPAQWRRLDCNQVLPRNPNNFRFAGVDGHGKQYMVRDPNSNNGTAVIRIDNNRNNMEGYTGDIMWNGGSNGGGVFPPPPNGGGNWRQVNCPGSQGRQYCGGTRGISQAEVISTYQGAKCVRGSSFGIDGGGLWVRYGCAGTFRVR